MNMKKLSLAALSMTLSATLLAGCGGAPATSTPAPTPAESAPVETTVTAEAVKTGLSMVTSVAKSKDASADGNGQAQANVALVAVTVGDDGVIDACVIDAIQSKIDFDAQGKLVTDPATKFPSKNELGEAYGMKKGSSIGKEWNEQAAAFAQYAVGKTVEELKGIAVNEDGQATDADLAASVTLEVADFVSGIEAAVNNASHMGAQKGDKLALTTSTNMAKSKDASADADGLAQAYATVAAVTLNGDTVTSCYIDSVQANVNFNAAGAITTDLTAAQPTKNELGDAYGMKKKSEIGKEWNEQAAAFCAYVTGKTVDEVAGIAVTEDGAAADADLAASVTIGIGEFQTLIEKAAQ
ncbi:MAG: hypothetical protein ACLSE7_08045 [Lachnospirales bacterium]